MQNKIEEQLNNLKQQQKNTEILYNKLCGAIEALETLHKVSVEENTEKPPAKKSKK